MADENKVKITLESVADGKGVEQTKKGQDEIIAKTKEQTAATKEGTEATKEQTAAEQTQAANRGAGAATPYFSGPGMPGMDAPGGAGPHVEEIRGAAEATKDLADATALWTSEEEQAIFVGKQMAELQAERDIAMVKAEKQAQGYASAMAEVVRNQKAMVALQTATHLSGMISRLREAASEGGVFHDTLGGLQNELLGVETAVNGFTAGLGTFLATGNAAAAVGATAATSFGGLMSAISSTRRELDLLATAGIRHQQVLDDIKEAQAELAKQISLRNLKEEYGRELANLEAQERAYDRLTAKRRALAAASQDQADANVRLAEETGGDVNQAKRVAIGVAAQNEQAEIDARLDEAKKNQAGAEKRANDLFEFIEKSGLDPNGDEYEKKLKEFGQANVKAYEALLAAKDAAEVHAAESAALAAKTASEQASLTNEIRTGVEGALAENSKEVTDVVRGVYDKMRAEADKVIEEGGKTSGEFERQMGLLKTMLGDKKADNEQAYEMYHAITAAVANSTKLQGDFLTDITKEKMKIVELQRAMEATQKTIKDLGR
jgi:hypothetical protein